VRYRADPPARRIRPAGGRIGIPRSLGYDELRRFFDSLIEAHGFEAVVSSPSSSRTLAAGLERCIDEVCFPLKTFFGHLADLAGRGLDTVLVPRLVSVAKGRNLCPKFHVLPDLAASAYPELRVVAPYIDLHHSRRPDLLSHLRDACEPMLVELDAWGPRSRAAIDEAWRLELLAREEEPEAGGDLAIAVLGHLYAERDPFLGLGVDRELRRLGVRVVHGPADPPGEPVALEEGMYYEPTVRTARAIEARLAGGVDGIVLMTYFACGPDSYSADTFLFRLKDRGLEIPVLRLVLDEQTSAEGLITRLATFVDVARHRRSGAGA
jgi:predicted nucleotide-binding protein (sugar kinase/HSP70/actin superfamily)